MNVIRTGMPDVLILEPKVFGDDRGFFLESYNKRVFREATGLEVEFVQDNHSRSARNVLRGLHYQIRQAQGKLVRVVSGEIYDVAVDLRKSSATFGRWVGFSLTAESRQTAWIPPGFAHGFLVMSAYAEVLYKATDYYAPQHEKALLWSDERVGVRWPLTEPPILSGKDSGGTALRDAEVYA